MGFQSNSLAVHPQYVKQEVRQFIKYLNIKLVILHVLATKRLCVIPF